MQKKLFSSTGLIVLAVAFITFIIVMNQLVVGQRLDLTENDLYSLSDSTQEIVAQIDEPITLNYFFSDLATKDIPLLRNYATRVREFLQEVSQLADGRIQLNIIDPVPFSEAEDRAAELGLQSVPLGGDGSGIYFGLVATNTLDNTEVVSFFHPDKEAFLEYDIAKIIHKLNNPKKPLIGLIAELPLAGGFDFNTRATKPGWAMFDQIKQLFDVRQLSGEFTQIADDIDILMVVHPKGMPKTTQYAVDQFVLNGGKAMIFVDPLATQDPTAQGADAGGGTFSALPELFKAWGILLLDDQVVGDVKYAMEVATVQSQAPQAHPGYVNFNLDAITQGDVVTQGLENITMAMAGILQPADGATTTFESLIQSSSFAMPYDAKRMGIEKDPKELMKSYEPTGELYTVAARITGPVNTAFPDGLGEEVADEKAEQLMKSKGDIHLIVLSDTDILTDMLWVQVQQFYGQQMATPWANNADFVVNALDNLSGSSELINIRSRGQYSRPFERVQALKREANVKFLAKEQQLQQQLAEAEKKLADIQVDTTNNQLIISPEQEQALRKFQADKILIRKELRNVRHQLDKEIASLGSWLKFLNIGLFPILLTLFSALGYRMINRKTSH